MYQIIQKSKIWIGISATLVGLSVASLALWGLNLGIDFTGGSYLEVRFEADRPSVTEVQDSLGSLNLGSLVVQPVGEKELILRFRDVNEDEHQLVLTALEKLSGTEEVPAVVEELRFDSVGPSIGKELSRKSFQAMFFVFLFIISYIAWSFRKVSRPVESWKYGVTATIALVHDALIVLGVFSVLGHFYGVQINTPFIAAILTVMGFSVHDTIVVFDRIRENLPKSSQSFDETVNASLNQTMVRSMITSGTVLLVLTSIYIYGGASIRDFALALLVGIFFGTYSSIFLASPLVVAWEKYRK
jgi:preprotein translocase subunit SecF